VTTGAPEAGNGLILDGYPMTVEQAEFLDALLEARGISGLKVIYLNVPDEVSLDGMKASGKSEYKSSISKERLRIFRAMIGPLAGYYGEDTDVRLLRLAHVPGLAKHRTNF